MSCFDCLNPTLVVDDRCVELSNSYPYLNAGASTSNLQHLINLDIDLQLPSDRNFKYYSPHDFHSNYDINECFKNNRCFSTIHCNIRSLSANFDNLLNMLSELYYSFSLIGLTETKFKVGQPEVTNTNILGYQFISQPSHSMAGGVGFYIKNSLSYMLRTDLTTTKDEFEALWIELQNKGKTNVICGVIYRHPSGNLDTFLGYLNSGIEKISQENKIYVLMGDFNVDLLKVDSHLNSDKFLNIMVSYFFQPHILQPTRITDHSATLIDNIFLNTLDHFVISGNIVYDLTDHLPNFLIFDKFTSLPSNMKLYKRDYSTLNYEKLVNDVQIINWSEVLVSELDPSSMFHLFYDQISAIIDKHIPFKQITRKEVKLRSKPWITPAIKRSIQVKNKWQKIS